MKTHTLMFRNNYKLILTFFTCIWTFTMHAQQTNYEQPPNSSYLAQYGLSPKVFNTILNPMYQEAASFEAKIKLMETIGGKEYREEYGVHYDPFYEYGLTLQLIVHDPVIYESASKTGLRKSVGKTHEKYKKIRDKDIIDEDDVGLVSENGQETVLGFGFKKSNLPKSHKYLHDWQGRVYLSDNSLERIELRLLAPTKIGGVEMQEASYIAKFEKLESGGYVLQNLVDSRIGKKKDVDYSYNEIFESGNYYDKNGTIISGEKDPISFQSREGYKPDTFKVRLERSLPILGNAARKAGYELPLPFGVDVFTHFQREELGLESIIVNGENISDLALRPGGSSAVANTNIVAARADVWILPFLNLTLMSGYMGGVTEVNLALSDEIREIIDDTGNLQSLTFNTPTTGPMVGGGITVAGGYKNFFATVNTMYILQFVQEANTEVEALAMTPLVGVRFPKIINFFVGAQYQIYDTKISGSISTDDGPLNYTVDLKATEWNFIVGLQRDFSNHFNGSIMVGGVPRPQATVVFGYRF